LAKEAERWEMNDELGTGSVGLAVLGLDWRSHLGQSHASS